nr:hypothetical protein [uncultured Prevotella sp.]
MIVIHPKDRTTQMLEILYEATPHEKVNDTLSKNQLRRLLYAVSTSEPIMLLGHGCEEGLLTRNDDTKDDFKKLIDHSFSHILKKHNGRIFAIFCHAKDFAEKEHLHGLFSGMIISEMEEAESYGIPTTIEELDKENIKLAKNLRVLLDKEIPWCEIPRMMQSLDDSHTPLTEFNYHSFFYL